MLASSDIVLVHVDAGSQNVVIGPRLKLSIDAFSVIIDVSGAVEVGSPLDILQPSLRCVRVGVADDSDSSKDSGEDGSVQLFDRVLRNCDQAGGRARRKPRDKSYESKRKDGDLHACGEGRGIDCSGRWEQQGCWGCADHTLAIA